jgi:hypothetical protein
MGEYDFVYVHTDIPEGMTIREWRAARARRIAEVHDAERRRHREHTRATLVRAARRVVDVLVARPTIPASRVRGDRPASP